MLIDDCYKCSYKLTCHSKGIKIAENVGYLSSSFIKGTYGLVSVLSTFVGFYVLTHKTLNNKNTFKLIGFGLIF